PHRTRDHRALHSFPTRRSSDLQGRNKASTNIETQSSSDFWQELNDTLRMLVPDGEGRNVVINDATGVIMVRAMPDELRSVANYLDRKSTRLNSSHVKISYAVFC